MNCIKASILFFVLTTSLSVQGQYSLPGKEKTTVGQLSRPALMHSRIWDSSPLLSRTPEVLPLFCEWERKIEANTRIPFRFRLGNLQYVDELEAKWQGHRN